MILRGGLKFPWGLCPGSRGLQIEPRRAGAETENENTEAITVVS